VHCGFCTATCPTYQLLGDELDGPRGPHLPDQAVLEGEAPTRKTQLHLDRCLTCRNCESTCPSGVQYGRWSTSAAHRGRKVTRGAPARPALDAEGRPHLAAVRPAMKLGQACAACCRSGCATRCRPQAAPAPGPRARHARKVLMLAGCVQPSMMPNINSATARVLDAAGIQAVVAPRRAAAARVKFHLNDQDGGRAQMRRNIDAWWPYVEQGEVEAIVMNASGCGVTVREYGHHLQHDAAYADKASASPASRAT
jgi:glycolate oxidase iron-sulfur subunit